MERKEKYQIQIITSVMRVVLVCKYCPIVINKIFWLIIVILKTENDSSRTISVDMNENILKFVISALWLLLTQFVTTW